MMRRLLLLLLLLCGATPALAHTLSETHSTWRVVGHDVQLTFTVPEQEAKRLAPSGSPSDQQVGLYLARNVAALTDGKPCRRSFGPEAGTAQPGYRRFEFKFDCPYGRPIEIRSTAFFDLVPSHVNYAQIITAKGDFVEQIFTKDQETLSASTNGPSPLQNASFWTYIGLGVRHIFTGVDHMSFLLGLVLISRRLRDLAFVITGFTVGHSVTLALAVTGILDPQPAYIDTLIAFTIALIGAENIAVTTHRPGAMAIAMAGSLFAMAGLQLLGYGGLPALLLLGCGIFSANYLMMSGHLHDAARLRVVVTLVFGLIHGFGFAATLQEMQLPTGSLARLLLGFNTGVEIGQLTLVLIVSLAAYGLVKLKLALPRPIVVDVCSAFLVGLGVFWFVSRNYA